MVASPFHWGPGAVALGYFQLFIGDGAIDPDVAAPTIWDDDTTAFDRHLAVATGTIVVNTDEPSSVVFTLDVRDTPAPDDLERWGHVVEASVDIPSGVLLVAEYQGNPVEVPPIAVTPGSYRVRVSRRYENDNNPDDPYAIAVWPAPASPPTVLRSRQRVWAATN